jgi:hypothetical protein
MFSKIVQAAVATLLCKCCSVKCCMQNNVVSLLIKNDNILTTNPETLEQVTWLMLIDTPIKSAIVLGMFLTYFQDLRWVIAYMYNYVYA